MNAHSQNVLALFGEPTRETSLHAISKALLRIRSTGVTCAALGKLLGYHFPQEFSLIEALWNCRPVEEPTVGDRLDALESQIDALRRVVVA